MNITKLSISRPTLVVVFFTVLIFMGIYSFTKLNYELMPDFSSPVFTVVTVYPGASPSEVENSVSKKIEDAISTVENVENIRSVSQEGVSMVIVELKLKADIDYSLQEAQRKINTLKRSLPENIQEPSITKISVNDFPIMSIGATSNMDPVSFYDILKYRIQPELQRIEGVGAVTLSGGSEREIKINLNVDKLKAYNLSAMKVLQAIQASNQDFPTGKVKNENSQMVIRLSAKYKSVKDIQDLVISVNIDHSPVKLRDLAEVLDTQKEPTTITRINGINSVGLIVQKQADANTVEVSHLIKKKLDVLEKEYKHAVLKFEIPVNSSEFTEKAAEAVINDLGYAVLLVALVMLVFLHSLRNAFIVMIAVPISLIISFTGIYLLGYTLNMMTLLALSLVIGILVDDAIVVMENIYRHLEMGKDRIQATLEGRAEIGFTAVAITLVDVVVFLPIALSQSLVSPIIKPYAMVIVITTLLSMLVAFTAVPLLTSRLGKISFPNAKSLFGKFTIWFEKLVETFASVLHNTLVWSFRHKILTFTIAALLFISSAALIPAGFVGSEFAGMGDASEFILQVELPRDAPLTETNKTVQQIEHILFTKKEIKSVFSTVGASGSSWLAATAGNYKAELDIKLIEKKYRNYSSIVYANKIKNELSSEIKGAKITVAVVNPFVGGADDSPLQVIIKSDDLDSLDKYSEIVKNIVESVPGAKDIKSTQESTSIEIAVEINKERMADLGLSLTEVGQVMQTAFSGNTDAKFREGAYEYDINIIFNEFNRRNIKDVSGLEFTNSSGKLIKLSDFAAIKYSTGPVRLERYDRVSSVSIEGQVLGRASGDVGDEIKNRIATLSQPAGVTVSYDGDMKYQEDAFGSLGFALLTSIFLVYMIMVALYESYLYPFVVLFSIPLAVIGAITALALANANLSIFSMLGMIMLVGLVAKNAILVVDFTNNLRKSGYRVTRALLTATRLRIRPVLMTTMSMIIGLMPIAIASGAASEWKNGLAWVLIGGLTSSMFLTLVIVPVVYLVTDTLKQRLIILLPRLKLKAAAKLRESKI